MNTRDGTSNGPAWGLAAGLLAGSAMTLLAIFSRHEPGTVLYRVVIGSLIVTATVATAVAVCRPLFDEDDD